LSGWSLLQSKIAPCAFGTALESNPVTLASNCTEGSVLIACVAGHESSGQSGSCTSVKDGAGNAFTKLAEVTSPADSQTDKVFSSIWALATPAGDVGIKPTFTATPSALATYAGGLIVEEVAGITAALDGTIASASGTASPTGTPAYSTSVPGEYTVAYYADTGVLAVWTAPGTPWAVDAANENGNGNGCNQAVAYKSSAGGTESDGWSYTPAGASWVVFLGAFELAAASSAAPPNRPRGQAVNRASTY
jgi:hypothetical protein